MSNPILRRNSSKQGLQDLLKVTAQRSMEDAEEIERERRRRARERQQGQGRPLSPLSHTTPSLDNDFHKEDGMCDSDLKAGGHVALEEDEGFSDWTQRLERRKLRHLEEQREEEQIKPNGQREEQQREDPRTQPNGTSTSRQNSHSVNRPNHQDDGWERRRAKHREEEWERRVTNTPQDASENFSDNRVTEKKKEVKKISYTSKVFMPQDMRHLNINGDTAERTTYLVAGKLSPSRHSSNQAEQAERWREEVGEAERWREEDGEVEDAFRETEQKLEKFHQSYAEKEGQELEELKRRQEEEQRELEELNQKREEIRILREEEERRREEEGQRRQVQEEEEKQRMREDIERRRSEAMERRVKNLSISSNDGDEHFSPMSPTFKNEMEERVTAENTCTVNERTEALNRSLKKSNSIKTSLPPVAVSKIDNRLEQYTQAIEISSKEANAASKMALMDIPSPTEPVASKKNLFEGGEAWGQISKSTPAKDTDGIKVGVSDLITQWVKGNPEDPSRIVTSKPAEIKPGDVLSKKNMWENLGDTPSSDKGKGTSSGKRFKFVVTGHGKYEKIPVSDDYNEHTDC